MRRILVSAVASAALLVPAVTVAQAGSYSNCTQLHSSYRHGVGRAGARDHVRGSTAPVTNFYRSTRLYRQNSHLDRDGDGVACERH